MGVSYLLNTHISFSSLVWCVKVVWHGLSLSKNCSLFSHSRVLVKQPLIKSPNRKQAPGVPTRRDSAWSALSSPFSIPEPSSEYKGKSFYTARVVVPVALPKGSKIFVPSFHSCLVSRIYGLDLYVSIQTPNTTVKDPTLHLKLPIQISTEGSSALLTSPMSSQELGAIASQQVDEIFNSRSVAPPSSEFMGRASLSSAPAENRNRQASIMEAHSPPSPQSQPQQRVSFAEDTPPMPGPG